MAELCVTILTTIVGLLDAPAKIKEYVIEPLKLQFSYLCRSDSIIESLKAKVQMLDDTTSNLQQRVASADHNLEIVEPDVRRWFERVDKIKKETDRILRPKPEVQQGCVNGSCPNLKLRYSASREATKIAKAIDDVLDAGKFDRVAHPAPLPGRETIPVVSGTDFKSRENTEERIMAALKDDKVYLIGICGMGGVGKTTMVKKIEKRAREENLFRVAMAVVSQQPDLKRMQKQIAEDLDLKLKEDESVSIRARQIYIRLTKETRILIIIDDIWERMNLEELGIPSQSNHKGCKIILTSRDRSVCKGMEAMLRHVGTEIEATEIENTRIFPLKCLDEEEAWSLFRAKIGSYVADSDLHQIAKEVAKECKGLPLALDTVGCALAEQKAKHVWEDALEQLKKSAPLNIPGVLKGVYQPLEWSYKQLESDEARNLFLLCCLFPEDSRISLKNLLYYGVGLCIFSNVETLTKARNRVYGLVEMLESRNMLMDDGKRYGIEYVKMHDVIRDMAIHITSAGKHVFMISHDIGLNDWPRKDSYENYTCISITLTGKDITLPECINCPRLKMLRIKFDRPHSVRDTFFYWMRELNVLDIGNIVSLPSSLQLLTNLRTLRLRGSRMRTASMIGQLVKLEILDLRDSELEVLPKEIGGLENLKSLDLSSCSHLREIAPGVISSLKRLEELFLFGSLKNLGAEVEREERRNAVLVEVASLKNLIALQLDIPDPKGLTQDTLHWPKLERFVTWIGPVSEGIYGGGGNILLLNLSETTPLVHALISKSHWLELNLGGMDASDEAIRSIQGANQNLESLTLKGCGNIKYLANIVSKENIVFQRLLQLKLLNCRDLEVISFGQSPSGGSFNALDLLQLEDLCKLTHLFDQKVCLPYLSSVCIQNCSSLQYVFLQSNAEILSQLKTLVIDKCPVLEEVFKAESRESADIVNPIVFPNLTTLRLEELPNLISFCKAFNGIDCPLLEYLNIKSLHNVKVCWQMEESSFFEQGEHNSVDGQFLFHQKVTFASLVDLRLCNLRTATKIFSSQIPIGFFSRLELLEVNSCPNLKVIFSPSALRNFGTLYNLIVTNCSKLEEVVREEAEESQAVVIETLFPELKNLELSKLPNFKTFCYMKNGIELPKVKSILIEDCHEMETFSIGSLRLPHQFYVFGLLEPDLATRIFLKKQAPRHEIHLEKDSFTLSAKDLSSFESDNAYDWCLAKDSSDNFIVVARLHIIPKLRIGGRFEMVKLLPRTLYEVAFEIMLEEPRFQLGGLVNLELTSSEGITQERSEDLKHRPRKEWIEVLAGEFTTGSAPIGDLEFALYKDEDPCKNWSSSFDRDFFDGLLIKGVTIRPKA